MKQPLENDFCIQLAISFYESDSFDRSTICYNRTSKRCGNTEADLQQESSLCVVFDQIALQI